MPIKLKNHFRNRHYIIC